MFLDKVWDPVVNPKRWEVTNLEVLQKLEQVELPAEEKEEFSITMEILIGQRLLK